MLYSDDNEFSRNPKYKYLPSVYAHGDLMHLLGFDIVGTDNIAEYNSIYNDYINQEKTMDLKITDNEGNIHDVKAYLWEASNRRKLGLIVFESDEVSVKFAKEKQASKQ